MAHNYWPYELAVCKTLKLPINVNSVDGLEPFYNIYDNAKESKFRWYQAF